MNGVTAGLMLSGVGILITFLALGILILIIVVLKTMFPAGSGSSVENRTGRPDDREELKKQAAAVGVAVLREKESSRPQGSLGKLLENRPGPWWNKGQDHSRGKESR